MMLLVDCGARTDLPTGGYGSGLTEPSTDTPGTVTFASGPDWASYSSPWLSDGGLSVSVALGLGPARDVCIAMDDPPNCPAGALLYTHTATPGWTAGAAIPQAFWIWRGDVEVNQSADYQVATFQKSFVVGAQPTGLIQVAADDMAQVFVNGIPVGSVGSITDVTVASYAQNNLTPLDLTFALAPGSVTVTVVAQNGPPSFAGFCGGVSCTYAQNMAGVVFAGTIQWK
jgi:hypothetical protein